MPSPDPQETPVLVVGAGPAGLAAAIELARHDVPSLLVERRPELSSHPRATVLSLRSMELVRAWGLEADVRARSADVDWHMLEAETLADAAAGSPLTVGYPNPEQSRMLSPTAPACIAQDDVEPLLLEHLRAAPHARVELGTQLTGLFADADGVRADLRDTRTGAVRTVHARYVVAADGARSAVRSALGIRMIGPDRLMEGMTTLFHAPLWEVAGEHRHPIYSITHPEVPSVLIPTGPSDRWLFGGFDDAARDEARTVELIRLAAGVPDLPVRSAARAGSPQAHSSPSAGASAGSSSPATRRIASRRAAEPASTWRCTTATTSAGSSAGCCAAGLRLRCWTATRPSAGPSSNTPPPARRTPAVRSGRSRPR